LRHEIGASGVNVQLLAIERSGSWWLALFTLSRTSMCVVVRRAAFVNGARVVRAPDAPAWVPEC